MPPAHWYTGIVTQIEDLAPRVKSFHLSIPEVEIFSFKPGQFVTFDLPVGEKRIQRWRSYSIASAPSETNEIELCIVHFEHGLGSSYFFEQVELGTQLKFKSAEGGFMLPDVIDHDLVMICTGTGIAPFRSMIQDIFQKKMPHKKIHLIFGTRKKDDILYIVEWEALMNTLPDFKFDVSLSREQNLNNTPYLHTGYVHPIYQNEYANVRSDVHFYICGWSKMIDQAVANLFLDMKYSRNQIHYELYG